MRAFLTGLIVTFAAVIGAAWFWVASYPMAFLDYEYPMWRYKVEKARDCDFGNVPIIGDSRATSGLIPALLDPKVVNLALGGISPAQNFFLVQHLLDCPTPPKAVLLSFAIFDFIIIDFHFWGHAVKFGQLSFDDLEDIRRQVRALNRNDLFGPATPGDTEARLKDYLYTHRFPAFYFDSLIGGRIYQRQTENMRILSDMHNTRGYYNFGLANGSKQIEMVVDRKFFPPSPIIDVYFDKTLALFQAHHIPVYFIVMPTNDASLSYMHPNLVSGFRSYLQRYTSRYSYFHILGDSFPYLPWTNFGDNVHLNPQGAAQLSDRVRKELRRAHVPGGKWLPSASANKP